MVALNIATVETFVVLISFSFLLPSALLLYALMAYDDYF